MTGAADFPAYTGPSVTNSEVGATGITPSQIGAAVALPLLAIAAAVGGYIAWNKYKKKPEKKRWSAVGYFHSSSRHVPLRIHHVIS